MESREEREITGERMLRDDPGMMYRPQLDLWGLVREQWVRFESG